MCVEFSIRKTFLEIDVITTSFIQTKTITMSQYNLKQILLTADNALD